MFGKRRNQSQHDQSGSIEGFLKVENLCWDLEEVHSYENLQLEQWFRDENEQGCVCVCRGMELVKKGNKLKWWIWDISAKM